MNLNVSKNSNKNRDRLDIVRDMLTAASTNARKTRIMYQANMNFAQVERYLKILLNQGLLEHDGRFCYLITEKGKEFLKLYTDYLERRKRLNEEVNGTAKRRLLLERMCFNFDDEINQSEIG
jgi:predicted transcriptional regulator